MILKKSKKDYFNILQLPNDLIIKIVNLSFNMIRKKKRRYISKFCI